MVDIVRIGDATLYHGDCLEILPTLALAKVDAVITDPVWPTCPNGMFRGWEDPGALLSEAMGSIDAERIVIVMGWDCDPRFLTAIPERWPFIRSQQLPYVFPGYSGKLLRGDECAYIFGSVPKRCGTIPGRARVDASGKSSRDSGHPSERSIVHFRQLCGWWCEPACTVLDPFMGSGTTGVAALDSGRKFTGIEIERKYFDIACERIENAQRQGTMIPHEPAPKPEQQSMGL